MALFDAFAIVDWSAANTPTTGKDSIWIALGEREDGAFRLIETVNPPTRSAAMARLRQFFRDALAADKRVFAGFDFPFGLPADFVEEIGWPGEGEMTKIPRGGPILENSFWTSP